MAKRDPGARQLYAWENGFRLQVDKGSWATLRAMHKLACKLYGVPPIPIRAATKHDDTSYYHAGVARPAIYLKDRHRLADVIVHETAHYISDFYLGHDRPHHDDAFIGVYLWLLVKMKVFTPKFLKASIKPYGVNFAPISPTALKRRQKKTRH